MGSRGESDGPKSARTVFADLKNEVAQASNRYVLSEIYSRAAYLISLTYTQQWEERFGKDVEKVRASVINEFRSVARAINLKARELGFCTHYDEEWRFNKSTLKKSPEKRESGLVSDSEKKAIKDQDKKRDQLSSEPAE